MNGDDKIEDWYAKLDEIDFEVMDLLEKRFEVSKKLSDYKKLIGFYVNDKGRNQEALQTRVGRGNLNPEFIAKLFDLIFEEAKKKHDGS